MWINNEIFKEDLQQIVNIKYIPWENFKSKTILITGGTGLIGSTLISALLYADRVKELNLKIIALVRDLTKAEQQFAEQQNFSDALSFVVGTVEKMPAIDMPVDYIVHGAGPTASNFLVEHPVETIRIAVLGTANMLEIAKAKKVKGFVYLSSMEVYGAPHTDTVIEETQGTTVDTMSVRSCYPEAKRLCESLCASYFSEYGVPAMVIRLAQTFGPGVAAKDQRVFAEFARCAMNRKDIVLQTAGTSKRCYLYTADAVTAILTLLLTGNSGEAYNAANNTTYCSIVEMAQMVAEKLGDNKIKVIVAVDGKHEQKFPPTHKLNLGIGKLQGLGWNASRNLLEMYARMMGTM
ncbi:MAG: NAD-dependent epimerase/dehydratase family protein [Phascolarctobacterium sp.]|uniref:NAD-dependent epimerase/dehydratase family protein n=1 Tax=Phascolarctobacterium sp. TaxID=2049039 RepID=UPI0026DB4CFF|nr:NAD-dependent epimerase/dehydratase family protein [Phascolarctobacterium sp.]MDO4920369.1 NAD-dependent epimerase/dehydratase family protein [Phascolarctobacterium sp.]